jgi:hypothetical protein
MSLKKYYDLLGLPVTASETDVRKQYRKLVMRLHPDKNPLPSAKEKFIQVTEAYEIITGKKEAPITSRSLSKNPEKTHEDRVKEAKKRYFEQQEKERMENEYYYRSLFRGNKWKIIRLSSIPGLIIAVFILLDLFFPHHFSEDRVTHYAKDIYSGGPTVSISLIKTKNGDEYWISKINYLLYGEHPDVYIEQSWVFHQPVAVVSVQKLGYEIYDVYYTFYQFSILIAVLCLLPFLLIRYKRKTIMYTVFYHIGLYVSPGLILIYLIVNDHWAHLLTLGFL